jgi:hypothetical protein
LIKLDSRRIGVSLFGMETPLRIQGREVFASDLELIRQLLRCHPDWSRYRLSRKLAEHWNWRNGAGQLKDIASRSLLRKLSLRGLIELPAPRVASPNRFRHEAVKSVVHDTTKLDAPLHSLRPLQFLDLGDGVYADLFSYLLSCYHYLGFRQSVGENLRYLVASNEGRPLACVLFGSAAWKCAARDHFIGWDCVQRQRHLGLLANNHRFLVLPWIHVSCLASHVLGLVSRRVSEDWESRYGHRIVMLETFVNHEKFCGSCYRAANWRVVGQTCGRSRQDRHHDLSVPVKDVYVYWLAGYGREELCR